MQSLRSLKKQSQKNRESDSDIDLIRRFTSTHKDFVRPLHTVLLRVKTTDSSFPSKRF